MYCKKYVRAILAFLWAFGCVACGKELAVFTRIDDQGKHASITIVVRECKCSGQKDEKEEIVVYRADKFTLIATRNGMRIELHGVEYCRVVYEIGNSGINRDEQQLYVAKQAEINVDKSIDVMLYRGVRMSPEQFAAEISKNVSMETNSFTTDGVADDKLPPLPEGKYYYKVRLGDKWETLSAYINVSVDKIKRANPDIASSEDLKPGQIIILPITEDEREPRRAEK